MASLLNRVRSAATSASSSMSSSSTARSSNSFLKRSLYQNPVMSVSVLLGTIGCVLPLYAALSGSPREAHQGPGRLAPYVQRLEQMEAERKDRILHDIEGSQHPRAEALRQYLQHSAKYSREE